MSPTRNLVCCLLVSLCTVACGGSDPPRTLGNPDAALNGGSGGATSSGGSGGAAGNSSGVGGIGSGAGGADPSGAGGMQACLDTSSDPNNCGSCGNRCGSVRIASGQSFPQAIAVKGGIVYWVTSGIDIGQGQLMKVSVAGGVPVTLASGREFGRITADESSVYFTDTNAGTVMKVPVGGGTPTTLASKQIGARAIAVDATHVYWTTYSTAGCPDSGGPCSPDGTIVKVPIGGGTPVTLASGQESPGGLAVDGQNVYWTSLGIRIQDGAVLKVPLAGGATTTLASGQWGVAGDIAVGADYVYWTGSSGGPDTPTVRKVPIGGGSVTAVVSGLANGAGIAVDQRRIYWVNFDVAGGSVRSVPIDGGTPTVLAGPALPAGLAIDGTNVYWTEGGASGVVASLGANTCEGGVCRCPAGTALCFGSCVAGESCGPSAPSPDAGQPDYCTPCADGAAAMALACPAHRPTTESELNSHCAAVLRTGRASATVKVGECTIFSGLPLSGCNATSPDPNVDVLSVISFPVGVDCHYARASGLLVGQAVSADSPRYCGNRAYVATTAGVTNPWCMAGGTNALSVTCTSGGGPGIDGGID